MLCRILIGLGGSEESRSALELGLRWAKRHNTQLVGLDIVDNPGFRWARRRHPSRARPNSRDRNIH